MGEGRFATAINCMDGRTQLAVIEHVKQRYGVDFVDMITEPGPIKALSEGKDAGALASMKRRAEISVRRHGSGVIAIAGHHDCAGNPVDKETQIRQLRESAATVESWGFEVEVALLWVGEDWKVQPLD